MFGSVFFKKGRQGRLQNGREQGQSRQPENRGEVSLKQQVWGMGTKAA